MIQIQYSTMVLFISILWIINRILCNRGKTVSWKRELELMLVYICIVVIVRFTFCPFAKINGKIQPLVLYLDNWFPFRINRKAFVYMFGYDTKREAMLNFIGNIAMFIPVGIVWPAVFKELNKPWKVIPAGVGFSLLIEILQLPFYDRVSDIDDLILNSAGFLTGYLIYLLIKTLKKKNL